MGSRVGGRFAQLVPAFVDLPTLARPQVVDAEGFEMSDEQLAMLAGEVSRSRAGTAAATEVEETPAAAEDEEEEVGDDEEREDMDEEAEEAEEEDEEGEGEEAQEVGDDGVIELHEPEGSPEKQPLLGLAESLVLQYSFMQTRHHHLNHLLPRIFSHPSVPGHSRPRLRPPAKKSFVFPTPPPPAPPLPSNEYHAPIDIDKGKKGKGKDKDNGDGKEDGDGKDAHKDGEDGDEKKVARKRKQKPIDGPQAPAHEIECLARVTLEIGPMSFPNTELWLGRFVEPRAGLEGTVRSRPREKGTPHEKPPKEPKPPKEKVVKEKVPKEMVPKEKKRKEPKPPGAPSAKRQKTERPPRQRAPPVPTPGPMPVPPLHPVATGLPRPPGAPVAGPSTAPAATTGSAPPAGPTKFASRSDIPNELIQRVNAAATQYPWLSILIHKAARSVANKDELAKLGRVVGRLQRGEGVGEGPDLPGLPNGPTMSGLGPLPPRPPATGGTSASAPARPPTGTATLSAQGVPLGRPPGAAAPGRPPATPGIRPPSTTAVGRPPGAVPVAVAAVRPSAPTVRPTVATPAVRPSTATTPAGRPPPATTPTARPPPATAPVAPPPTTAATTVGAAVPQPVRPPTTTAPTRAVTSGSAPARPPPHAAPGSASARAAQQAATMAVRPVSANATARPTPPAPPARATADSDSSLSDLSDSDDEVDMKGRPQTGGGLVPPPQPDQLDTKPERLGATPVATVAVSSITSTSTASTAVSVSALGSTVQTLSPAINAPVAPSPNAVSTPAPAVATVASMAPAPARPVGINPMVVTPVSKISTAATPATPAPPTAPTSTAAVPVTAPPARTPATMTPAANVAPAATPQPGPSTATPTAGGLATTQPAITPTKGISDAATTSAASGPQTSTPAGSKSNVVYIAPTLPAPPPKPDYPLPPPFLLVAFKEYPTEKFLLPLGINSYISRVGGDHVTSPAPAPAPKESTPPPTQTQPESATESKEEPTVVKKRTRASLAKPAYPPKATPPPPPKEPTPPPKPDPYAYLPVVQGMRPAPGTVLISTFIPIEPWRRPQWDKLDKKLPFENEEFVAQMLGRTKKNEKDKVNKSKQDKETPVKGTNVKAEPVSPKRSLRQLKDKTANVDTPGVFPKPKLEARPFVLNLASESFLPDGPLEPVTIRLTGMNDELWKRVKRVIDEVHEAELQALAGAEPDLNDALPEEVPVVKSAPVAAPASSAGAGAATGASTVIPAVLSAPGGAAPTSASSTSVLAPHITTSTAPASVSTSITLTAAGASETTAPAASAAAPATPVAPTALNATPRPAASTTATPQVPSQSTSAPAAAPAATLPIPVTTSVPALDHAASTTSTPAASASTLATPDVSAVLPKPEGWIAPRLGPNVSRTLQSRKKSLFESLLTRVGARLFPRFRVETQNPTLVEATTDKWAPKPYHMTTRPLYTRGSPEPEDETVVVESRALTPELDEAAMEGRRKKRKNMEEPTVTFEMPVSLDALDERVEIGAAQSLNARRGRGRGRGRGAAAAALRNRQSRGTAGATCEGCAKHGVKVWRRGPNGRGTLCNSCGDKFNEGTLGELLAPGAASRDRKGTEDGDADMEDEESRGHKGPGGDKVEVKQETAEPANAEEARKEEKSNGDAAEEKTADEQRTSLVPEDVDVAKSQDAPHIAAPVVVDKASVPQSSNTANDVDIACKSKPAPPTTTVDSPSLPADGVPEAIAPEAMQEDD